ncbi:MAG: hypothetical protein FJ138_09545 [Deltaproteobacteria bacterium]|nr:hypothetical protein [Deltaproteobacteria bacterium]
MSSTPSPEPPAAAAEEVGRAWGKVVLFGEYAVLEGAPALVCATRRAAEARWGGAREEGAREEGARYCVEAVGVGTGEWRGARARGAGAAARLEALDLGAGARAGLDLPFAFAALRALDAPSGLYRVDTRALSAPVPGSLGREKLGLGSSGAATAALVDLVARRAGAPLPPAARFSLTQSLHRRVQGDLGSGADVAASVWGGLLSYRWLEGAAAGAPRAPGEEAAPVWAGGALVGEGRAAPLAAPLAAPRAALPPHLWVWMGQSASTPALVRAAWAWRARAPAAYRAALDAIDAARAAAAAALCDPRLRAEERARAFCDATAAGGAAARALGAGAGSPVWTPAHEALRALAAPLGGAVKPTGAGGGDLSLVSAPSGAGRARLARALREAGWRVVAL